jgi:hypothetical protein
MGYKGYGDHRGDSRNYNLRSDPFARCPCGSRLYYCQGSSISKFVLFVNQNYDAGAQGSFPYPYKTLVCVLGIVQLARGKASSAFGEPLFENSSTSPTSYALAFYSGLWAYDGWDQANYVGGEMVNPEKNIPRVIHFSMGLVTVSLSVPSTLPKTNKVM